MVQVLSTTVAKSERIQVEAPEGVTIAVATSLEDLVDCFKVRAIAFVAEQDCPMDDEFDGNDYSGTHIIVRLNGRPIATTRLRYFADFVKVERIAIMPKQRDVKLFLALVHYVREFVASKGFRVMYTQANERMQSVYRRFGFKPLGNQEIIEHFGDRYIAMVRHAPIGNSSGGNEGTVVDVHAPFETLNSVEGSWLHHG